MPPSNWVFKTSLVRPDSRSASNSPTQTMGVKPTSSAASVRFKTVSSVSPKN